MTSFTQSFAFVRKIWLLAQPFGKGRLFWVCFLVFLQGAMQVVGLTSIFPFLALAANPTAMKGHFLFAQMPLWVQALDDKSLLLLTGFLAILMLFVSNILNLLCERSRVKYVQDFCHWMRINLLRKIASQPYSYILGVNSSILHKKVVGDVMQFAQNVVLPLLDGCARIFALVLLLGLIFLTDASVAFAMAAGLGGFYALIFVYLNRRLKSSSDQMKDAVRGVAKESLQLLSSLKTIRIYGAEEYFIERISKHALVQARLLTDIPAYSNGPRYLVEPLAFGGLVSVVLFMAIQGRSFVELIPKLAVMALAAYRLIPTLQLLYGQLAQVTAFSHSVDEIYSELASADAPDGPIVPPPAITPARGTLEPLSFEKEIRLEGLTFAYANASQPVLQNISLTIEKNSSVAFVGRTGCGKSTLLDLILGLHTPQAGGILVDGKRLSAELFPAWRMQIGYVPQEIVLIDDTVRANVALGVKTAEIDEAHLRKVCEVAQILDVIENSLPEGFNTQVGERGVRLSGGQKQRIGLARALYFQPSLLILDEATSALDEKTETALVDAIERLAGSITIIVVAHRTSTVENCDKRYVLENGSARLWTGESHSNKGSNAVAEELVPGQE